MVDDSDNRQDEERPRKRDPFTREGEAASYVSLDQASVLGIQHARQNTDFYGSLYEGQEMLVEVIAAEEGEDYYHIRLSYRPARRFSGEPGLEQISIDKSSSAVALRQIVSEPIRKRALPIGTIAPWAAAVVALVVAVLFAVDVLPPGSSEPEVVEVEREVVREVPIEVEREVIREVPVEKIVEVEREVIREVPVEKIVEVEKVVIKEVPVEKIVEVEKLVIKEVPVERVVKEVVEVEKIVVATPTVAAGTVGRFGGTLRITSQGSISALDPVYTGFYVTNSVSSHIFEQQFAWDTNLEVAPRTVKSWEVSPDGHTYTFTMRDGLSFHKGNGAVMPEDIIASFNRWADTGSPSAGLVRKFTDTDTAWTVIDDETYQWTLDTAFDALFVLALPHVTSYITTTELASTPFSVQMGELIGTGAYELEE